MKCGGKKIEMENFVRLKEVYSEHFRSETTVSPLSRPFDGVPFAIQMSTWTETREAIALRGGDTLGSWLLCAHQDKSTLVRDKIYALLGLCKARDRKFIVSGYRLNQDGSFLTSDRQIFKEVTALASVLTALSSLSRSAKRRKLSSCLPGWETIV